VPRRAGVLGSPIAHSLSPVLHTAAYEALGLVDWEYSAIDVDVPSFRRHVASLDDTWRGLSLTMPLKEIAFDVAAQASALATATGAINTLVRRPDDRWDGHNTDVAGIRVALVEAGFGKAERAVILGSGATARSAVAALAALGVRHVDFLVRGAVRVRTVQQAAAAGLTTSCRAIGDWPDEVDVVASTVPGGSTDAAATLPAGGRVLLDVVYGGAPSALAAAAAAQGYAVVAGTEMLLHQAAEQVRLMTGCDAPVAAMRQALDVALSARTP
jgi:shikimate dehydrogenase